MNTTIIVSKETSKRLKDYKDKKKLSSKEKAINHALSIAELHQLTSNK
ncbi:MAG: hypothetical protein ACR2N3_04760 [Pyrinomonadaceae bacterium]